MLTFSWTVGEQIFWLAVLLPLIIWFVVGVFQLIDENQKLRQENKELKNRLENNQPPSTASR